MTINVEYHDGMFILESEKINYSVIENMYLIDDKKVHGVSFQGSEDITSDVETKIKQKCDEIHNNVRELKEIIKNHERRCRESFEKKR